MHGWYGVTVKAVDWLYIFANALLWSTVVIAAWALFVPQTTLVLS